MTIPGQQSIHSPNEQRAILRAEIRDTLAMIGNRAASFRIAANASDNGGWYVEALIEMDALYAMLRRLCAEFQTIA